MANGWRRAAFVRSAPRRRAERRRANKGCGTRPRPRRRAGRGAWWAEVPAWRLRRGRGKVAVWRPRICMRGGGDLLFGQRGCCFFSHKRRGHQTDGRARARGPSMQRRSGARARAESASTRARPPRAAGPARRPPRVEQRGEHARGGQESTSAPPADVAGGRRVRGQNVKGAAARGARGRHAAFARAAGPQKQMTCRSSEKARPRPAVTPRSAPPPRAARRRRRPRSARAAGR